GVKGSTSNYRILEKEQPRRIGHMRGTSPAPQQRQSLVLFALRARELRLPTVVASLGAERLRLPGAFVGRLVRLLGALLPLLLRLVGPALEEAADRAAEGLDALDRGGAARLRGLAGGLGAALHARRDLVGGGARVRTGGEGE